MIKRRTLLLAAWGALAVSGRAGAADAIFRLWQGTPPSGGGPAGPVEINGRGAISNIAVPILEVFAPTQPNGTAMLVAGGGGYKRIEMETEARPAARWLAARGVTAFVLTYHLPTEGWRDGPLAPLQDAQRALRLIRSQAGSYRIHPDRVGVLGFSAGGHLMGMAAVQSAFASYAPTDAADELSARPDAAALIYPVITLQAPYDHTSTRRSLVGDRPDPASTAEWSVETHVRPGAPPIFLVQADDDPISNPVNTRIMASACRDVSVPVEFQSLPSGGHGFGMGRAGTPMMAWLVWYEGWLRTERLIA